jgi:hypothetical protein
MRRLHPILLPLLLLSGCDREAPTAPEEESGTQLAGTGPDAALPPGSEDPARLQELIARAMPAVLPDAAKARYRDIRAGVGGAACGEVATPGPGGAEGPFRPFVVTPQAVAVVGTGPTIAFDDPSDFLADAWIRWCASPEELQRLAPELKRAAAVPAPIAEPAPEPDPLAGPAVATEPAPPPAPPPAREPAKRPPPPPPQIDSFLNSVQRKDQ